MHQHEAYRSTLLAAPECRGERDGAEMAALDLGLATIAIDAPGTLDGGDVLQVGQIVYVGRGGRTNAEHVPRRARTRGARRIPGRTSCQEEGVGSVFQCWT
jgi:N-dimethylarginine dimethylaminohydrolase